MLRNYLLIAFRFLAKNQLFTFINTLGLAVSISCTLLIYLYVNNELTYDEFHDDIDRLYILGVGVQEGRESEAAYYQTVYPALPAMLEEFPEIETGTRYFDWDSHILLAKEKKFMHQVLYVDSTFFQTLTFDLIEGDPETALRKKDQIVISAEIARKFFNTTDVLGQVIELENQKRFTISGVLGEVPSNSTIQPEVLLPLMEKETQSDFQRIADWYNTIAQVVIKLKPHANPDQLREKFPAFVKQHYDPAARNRILNIYPLVDLHRAQVENEVYVYGLVTIGIFILLIAVINFMNLSISSSLTRLRETGMRRLMGSSKRSIVLQFFLEAFLLSIAAITVSLGILQLLLPVLNDILGMSLGLSMDNLPGIAILSFVFSIVIASVAGGYPAMYLSRFKTVNAVKGLLPNYHRKVTLRNALVVLQFVVSVALVISVIVTFRQIYFMKTADLKFNEENVLVVNMNAGFKDENLARARLKGIVHSVENRADVISVSLSQHVPGRYSGNYNRFFQEGSSEGISLRKAYVDDLYLETYGIKMLEGENFPERYSDSSNLVMINSAALKAFGWESAEGKRLQESGDDGFYTVVGVFDDFHYRSLDGTVEPLIHFYFKNLDHTKLVSIRLVPHRSPDVLAFLEEQWSALDSWLGFTYFFVDEEFDAQYKNVERTLILMSVFAGVAIVLSCAGIFALSAIAARQRTKEIGIRKVLGASVAGIVGLLSKDFLRLVMVAVVLAVPLGWFGMSQWLNDFPYKTGLDWWIFALSGCVALLIAFLTTLIQSVKAAMDNPVDSLHND